MDVIIYMKVKLDHYIIVSFVLENYNMLLDLMLLNTIEKY
jgi:hypothetical protein